LSAGTKEKAPQRAGRKVKSLHQEYTPIALPCGFIGASGRSGLGILRFSWTVAKLHQPRIQDVLTGQSNDFSRSVARAQRYIGVE
jgi:hypothetical protein